MSETWKEIDVFLKAKGIRIGPPVTVQTTGGKHAANSFHYRGTARDYGIHDSDARAVARALQPLASGVNSPIAELFFAPLNIWYKHGFPIAAGRVGGHKDHCHVALEVGRHLPGSVLQKSYSTVKMGSIGPDVQILQGKLNKLGYHLVADGRFGAMTLSAVRSFQSKRGLAVDGIVGPGTWAALQ